MPDEKMKYPLLEFEYDKKLYEELLTLNPHPEFVDKDLTAPENYTHKDFGTYNGDALNALFHAANIIRQLDGFFPEIISHSSSIPESLSNSLNPYLESLCQDVKNYCTCVKLGNGLQARLQELMEVLLFYGQADFVYEQVIEWNKAENEGKPSPRKTFFDFKWLYIKQGDRFLFLEMDVPRAMKFYSLAMLTWKVDPSETRSSIDGTTFDYPRAKETAEFLKNFNYLLYSLLANKCVYIPYPRKETPPILKDTYDAYNQLMKAGDFSQDLGENRKLIASIITSAQKSLNLLSIRNSSERHHLRMTFLLVNALMKKSLITELFDLARDLNNEAFEASVLDKSHFFEGTPFYPLREYAVSLERGEGIPLYPTLLRLARAAFLAGQLTNKLRVFYLPDKLAYYTSADVFSYMLPEKCKDEKADRLGKLTVMHLSYMNDPNEGKTLRQTVYPSEQNSEKKKRKSLNVPFVFVKCFTTHIDYLPMWEMYGDHAQGCCLVIDWNRTKPLANTAEPPLYRVCYLNRDASGNYEVSPEYNRGLENVCGVINNNLEELRDAVKDIDVSEWIYLDKLLGPALYLFKDSSYSYEQELRVIYQTKDNILHTDSDKPWLFVQTPFPLQLDEVILGPKFPDVSTRVPYLQEQLDLMCEKTGTEKPRITLSEIDYR